MRAGWVCAALLVLSCSVWQGSAQTVPCYTGLRCGSGNVGAQASVLTCCSMNNTFSYRPSIGSESCLSCYGYGWVQNISDSGTRADPQTDVITAVEGETVTLTLYFTKNDPLNEIRFRFSIETDGTATEGTDYVVTPGSIVGGLVQLRRVPVQVNVTLLRDGIGGEGTEDIVVTLRQDLDFSPMEDFRILVNPTVRIRVQDNDIQTGFNETSVTIREGPVERVCLSTVGVPAVDTVLDVSVMYGTAGADDFNLVSSQVTITRSTTEPCVEFLAVADSLGLEGVEQLTLNLSGPPNVQLTTDTLSISIEDSDVVVFGFFEMEADGDEADGVIGVSIARSVATAAPMSFTLTPIEYNDSFGFSIPSFDPDSPNIATPGEDFPTDVIQVTIPPGNGLFPVPTPITDDNIAEDSEQQFICVLSFSGDSTGAVLGTSAILLGIFDNDAATIRFQSILESVEERDEDFIYNLIITRNIESELNYSIAISSSSITAEPEDYSVPDGMYRFPPEVSNISIPVTIRGDTRIELNELFEVTLSPGRGPSFLPAPLGSGVTVGISDNDGNYIYVPSQGMVDLAEGEAEEVTFVLLNPPPDGVFEFDFNVTLSTVDDTATAGSDYMAIEGEVIRASMMPNGMVTTTVLALDDGRVELEETFMVTGMVMNSGLIADGTGREFPVEFQNSLTLSINSDDVAEVRFDRASDDVIEGRSVTVCLEPVMTENLDANFTVQLSVVSGTAIEGADYEADDVMVTIGSRGMIGSGSMATEGILDSACISIDTLTDDEVEGDETFSVMIEIINNAAITSFPDGNTVPVTIQDATVQIAVEQTAYEVSEADGGLEVCVAVTGTIFDTVTLAVAITLVSATEGEDFILVDGMIILNFGSSRGCATIRILSDDLIEMAEAFIVEVSTNDPFAIITGPNATVTITRELAEISFERTMYSAVEINGGAVDVCIAVGNGRLANSLSIPINVLPTSTAIEGDDFEFVGAQEIVIPANMSRGCLTVSILESALVEGEEEIRLAIDSSVDATIVAGETTIVISPDGAVAIGFKDAGYTISEGETVALVVQKVNPFESDLDFVITSGSTSIGGGTFPAGGTERVTNISIPFTAPDNDIALEDDVVFMMNLTVLIGSSPQIARLNTVIPVVVQDDDGPVEVGFDQAGLTLGESDGDLLVSVSVLQAIASTVSVDIAVVSGTAMEQEDYVRTNLSHLDFPENGTMSVSVGILDDDLIEPTESFFVVLSNPRPAGVQLGISTFNITILDNDLPMIGFERPNYTTSEMFRGQEVCVVVFNGNVLSDLSVEIDLLPSTAMEGMDFDFVNGPPVVIAAGTSRGCLQISIIPSPLVEPTEEINLAINATTTLAVIGDFTQTTVFILSDGAITVGFERADYTYTEGEQVVVVVQKSGPLDSDIVFEVTGGGFSEQRTFQAGETGPNNISISLDVPDNNIALEPPRVIDLTLSVVSPADQVTLGLDRTSVTILDDDGPVTVGFDETERTVSEGGGNIFVLASIQQPIATPVSVDITFFPGTAGTDDFTRTGQSTLTFPSNGSQTILVGIDNDVEDEEAEMFSISLGNAQPSGDVIIAPDQITITITDDDETIIVGFRETALTVPEGSGSVMVPVVIAQPLPAPITVDVLYVEQSAREGSDFRTGVSSLTFTSNETQYILLSIIDNDEDEPAETFLVGLRNAQSEATVRLFPSSLTITITDNDPRVLPPLPPFVNNTVIGDPFYTAPIDLSGAIPGVSSSVAVSLCYELHGEAGYTFSLVNDVCTLVNAHYVGAMRGVDVNVIDRVAIRAKDSANAYRNISMSLSGGCSVSVDGTQIENQYDRDGVSVKRYANSSQPRVRVSVPNCNETMLVMWMICENRPLPATGEVPVNMVKFVIARGRSISEFAHGLLGQMWNVPFTVRNYTGQLGFLEPTDMHLYVTVNNTRPGPATRTFVATLQPRSWDRTSVHCLYAGNRQSGPTGDVPEDELPNDSVIEGEYTEYAVSDDFASDCVFCDQFGSV